MATSLLPSHPTFLTVTTTTTAVKLGRIQVRCGPRDNRGPLIKGRTLSTEAILAVQSLKRSPNTTNLTRLIKSDLIAALRELLRQDHCALALHALSVLQSEYRHVDLSVYAEVASALTRNGKGEEIEELVGVLEREGHVEGGERRMVWVRILKAVIGAGRREATVRICRLMRREWDNGAVKADEYAVKVLCKGLRKLGEDDLAGEVESVYSPVLR